jgi:hypothetical protein
MFTQFSRQRKRPKNLYVATIMLSAALLAPANRPH